MKKYTVKPKLSQTKRAIIGNNEIDEEFVYLGRLAETGSLIRIDLDVAKPHVISIFGKRGSGKSFTLGSIIEGLCTVERENSISNISGNQSVLLFDTLGIFQWMNIGLDNESSSDFIKEQSLLQKGWDFVNENLDVQVWFPKGMDSHSKDAREFSISSADFNASDWGYLMGVDILNDRMGQLLNDAYEKVVNDGWTDGEINTLPNVDYTLEDIIECVNSDTEIETNYHKETKRAITQQLSVFARNPLFQTEGSSQNTKSIQTNKDQLSSSSTSLAELLKPGKLSIVLLHKIDDELRLVLMVSLIRKIMHSRITTSEAEKNLKILPNLRQSEIENYKSIIKKGIPPTWIVADEAQNFLPSERKTKATDTIVRLVREGRNYGLSFMITTQQPTAIDQRILSQVDTLIVHKLTVQSDIEYVKRNIKSNLPKEVRYGNSTLSFDQLLRTLDVGQSIISSTESERTIIINIRPRVSVHGGFGI